MSFFGIPIRNGLAIGLGTVASLATDFASPNPGPPWIVLTSTGTAYTVDEVVLDSSGTPYYVVETVLSSTGASYNPI
jgi:hypothetical protein